MKIYQVGGCVRDRLRGQQPQDYDHVVVGSSPAEMANRVFIRVGAISRFSSSRNQQEYALARKEIKTGSRHRFQVYFRSFGNFGRRSGTARFLLCNALAFDPQTGEIIDPFGGTDDIKSASYGIFTANIFRKTRCAFCACAVLPLSSIMPRRRKPWNWLQK